MKRNKFLFFLCFLSLMVVASVFITSCENFFSSHARANIDEIVKKLDLYTANIALKGKSAVVVIRRSGEHKRTIGAGVIVDLSKYTNNDGKTYILTCHHVIDGDEKLYVSYFSQLSEKVGDNDDKNSFTMIDEVPKIIGFSAERDVAILSIEGKPLESLHLGNSPVTGQKVIVIGHPFGYNYSVSMGIVSRKESLVNIPETGWGYFMQTDAALNPGNSGGPVIDMNGKIVALSAAIYSPTMTSGVGLGFCVPIKDIKQLIPRMLVEGNARRGFLGIRLIDLSNQKAREKAGLSDNLQHGAYVKNVIKKSAAEKYGIKNGDIITEINDEIIINPQDLIRALILLGPNKEISVKILRSGKELNLKVIPN